MRTAARSVLGRTPASRPTARELERRSELLSADAEAAEQRAAELERRRRISRRRVDELEDALERKQEQLARVGKLPDERITTWRAATEFKAEVDAASDRVARARAQLEAARDTYAVDADEAQRANAAAERARAAADEAFDLAAAAALDGRAAGIETTVRAAEEVMHVVQTDEASAAPANASPGFGGFPIVAILVAAGVAICSVTDALSRATLAPSVWFLWAGVAVIVAPVVYRLSSADASPGERLAIVCLFGLALYAVKLMRDPFGYTMPDEFFHAFNAQQIASHHVLFRPDSLLPITSRFPGLEGATSALMSLTGMSSFGAGIILIGAARLLLMVALFLLFGKLSGSPRVAGIGAAVYAGNSNFLLWGAQFSYESLTLPLLVVVLAMVADRSTMPPAVRRAWFVPVLLVITTIVITHHLTSYLLDALLLIFALLPIVTRARMNTVRVWPFALASVALTISWLVVVASETVGYISPVIDQAFKQTLNTILGESSPRAPFSSKAGALGTPLIEQIVAFAALGILFVALPFGLRAVWRKHRREPLAIVLCLGALGFFGVLGLRLAPSAWEVANRLGEFLYIGLGFVVAYAFAELLLKSRVGRVAPAVVAVLAVVVVVGGAVTGWPADATLAAPTRVVAEGHQIQSEALAVGDWVGVHLPGAGFAAPQSDARTILLYGNDRVLTGTAANIDTLLTTPGVTFAQIGTLTHAALRYIVTDDRVRAGDNTHGYAFSVTAAGGTPDKLLSSDIAAKFDALPAPRVYDSGDVHIYDLKGLP